MTKRHESHYLEDILNPATLAVDFLSTSTRESFEKDMLRQGATLFQLAVIGEATKHISKEFRDKHPEIPWKKMAAMRDVLVHAYHELDLDIVWNVVSNSLPELISHLKVLK